MKVHYKLPINPVVKNAVVTIGTFDGVHQGHRDILNRLKNEAASAGGESVLITFHPHPRNVVLNPPQRIQLINILDEKIKLLEDIGIDHLVVVSFTEAFADQSAEAYIRDFLVKYFKPHTIIIGYDHRFGNKRTGDFQLLEQMAPIYNYQLREISAHELNQVKISSTRIRAAILQGHMKEANELLGYTFFFSGTVVHGDKMGRKIGYPTANLDVDTEKILPADGVYAVYASIGGAKYKGMMSIGYKPTFNGSSRTIEINLFDFEKEIYGNKLQVFVVQYLRPQVKYLTIEAMAAQIDKDKKASLEIL